MQANNAGYELKSIDKQISAQEQKIVMAGQDITNQQQVIDNASEVQEFLKNKYTNQDLYSWMEGNVRSLYYQTYTLAYQLAKRAEKAYCFERAIDPADANFISFGYWESNRDGLLSGERLFLGLKQLEAAYHDNRGYDFEVTKHVSLRQLNPLALFQLREKSSCQITLPEVLYDMDFPGHYQRRIKAITMSIPCVVGPYASISCTLRLLDNSCRISSIAKSKNDYPRQTDQDDARFRTLSTPISSIAVSTAQNDSGLFELNFTGERYVPFEGAGAESTWSLEFPSGFKQWDYTTITDVIMSIRYTSKDGGDKLKAVASSSVSDFVKGAIDLSRDQGLFNVFDLRAEFSSAWAQAAGRPMTPTNTPDPSGSKTITLKNLSDRLPAYTRGHDAKKILATDVYLMLSPQNSWVGQASLIGDDGQEQVFGPGDDLGATASLKLSDVTVPITSWQIKFSALGGTGTLPLERGWVVVRYTLG